MIFGYYFLQFLYLNIYLKIMKKYEKIFQNFNLIIILISSDLSIINSISMGLYKTSEKKNFNSYRNLYLINVFINKIIIIIFRLIYIYSFFFECGLNVFKFQPIHWCNFISKSINTILWFPRCVPYMLSQLEKNEWSSSAYVSPLFSLYPIFLVHLS